MVDVAKIKLVVWDLDDTFWDGTLAEGSALVNEHNVAIAKTLIDKGIMNSICSKNDFAVTKAFLDDNSLSELFVFPSINWSPKAQRIQAIIKAMALRPANVLFIDDNDINLNEAKYFLPELMTLNARELQEFNEALSKLDKSDTTHKRLKQYRILEHKAHDMSNLGGGGNNKKFLIQSIIKANIDYNLESQLDRIAEMVERTNQLNYTKLRSTKEELKAIIQNPDFKCGIVNVSDKYGDYGTVGFFALDTKLNRLIHFLFSCRTLGMRVEQWVYEQLNFPELEVVGEIAAEVEPVKVVSWINVSNVKGNIRETHLMEPDNGLLTGNINSELSILLKGPCDLSAIEPYLGDNLSKHITTEFNYVNKDGVSVTAFNTSTHLLGLNVNEDNLNKILESAPFLDAGAWKSDIFTRHWNIIFQSLLPDCHEGLYRHKKTGTKITFSSANYNLCNPENWEHFIEGDYTNHGFKFTKDILKQFSEEFEFIGFTPASEIVSNWKEIVGRLPEDTTIVFMLGVTMDKDDASTGEFKHHAENHKLINMLMKEAFSSNPSVKFIDYNDYVKQQSDFSDCINHFQRSVYHKIAVAIVDEINQLSANTRFRSKSKISLFGERAINKFKRLFHN